VTTKIPKYGGLLALLPEVLIVIPTYLL